jgi:hypothetical protein
MLSLDIGIYLSHDLGFVCEVNESKLRPIVENDLEEKTTDQEETYRKQETLREICSTISTQRANQPTVEATRC